MWCDGRWVRQTTCELLSHTFIPQLLVISAAYLQGVATAVCVHMHMHVRERVRVRVRVCARACGGIRLREGTAHAPKSRKAKRPRSPKQAATHRARVCAPCRA